MSVQLGFTVGSTYTVTIGVEALRAAVQGIKSLFDGFRRQPAWLQLAIAGALAAIVIHPKSRAKLVHAWESVRAAACDAKGPMFEGMLDLMHQVAAAQSGAGKTHQQIQAALPPRRRPPRLSTREESVWSAPARFRFRRSCAGCGMRVTSHERKILKYTFGACYWRADSSSNYRLACLSCVLSGRVRSWSELRFA